MIAAGGVPFEVNTGPVLAFMLPDVVYGDVALADYTTPAEGAIIYSSIGTSRVLSTLVHADGRGACD